MFPVDMCEGFKFLTQDHTARRLPMVLVPKAKRDEEGALGPAMQKDSWQVSEQGKMERHTHHTLYMHSVTNTLDKRKNKSAAKGGFPSKNGSQAAKLVGREPKKYAGKRSSRCMRFSRRSLGVEEGTRGRPFGRARMLSTRGSANIHRHVIPAAVGVDMAQGSSRTV